MSKINKATSSKASKEQSKARRPRSKGKSRRESERHDMTEANLDRSGRDNDPNWYFTSPELAQQASELSMQQFLGDGPIMGLEAVPTCMAVYLNPCPGESYTYAGETHPNINYNVDPVVSTGDNLPQEYENNDGASLMGFKTYTLLSTFTGRTQTYAPQDVMCMELAIAEVASISEHIRRMFGVALTMNARNRALPIGLLHAMGLDAENDFTAVYDFVKHLANYRMRFNIEMSRINQIPLLDNVGYIRKARDLYQKVYVDSDSPMAQNWFFRPYSTWQFLEAGSDRGSVLDTVDLNIRMTMDSWLNILSGMITNLLNSSTLQIIYADLLNLANKVNVPTWQFDYLAENYVVLPEYNATAQLQLHNLDIVGAPVKDIRSWSSIRSNPGAFWDRRTNDNDVECEPDENTLRYHPYWQLCKTTASSSENAKFFSIPHESIVDFKTASPSIEDKIEALRFSAMRSKYKIAALKTDSVRAWFGFGFAISDHYVVQVRIHSYPTPMGMVMDTNSVTDQTELINNIEKFSNKLEKFADHFYCYSVDVSSNGSSVDQIRGDFNYYTKVPFEYLARLNRLMFTGLFDFRV